MHFMANLLFILLQLSATESGADGAQAGNQWSFWVMLIIIFVVGYFIFIRPTKKERGQKNSQAKPNAYVKCPSCGNVCDANYEYCPHCGTKREKTCPRCHTAHIPYSAEFCPNCGEKL